MLNKKLLLSGLSLLLIIATPALAERCPYPGEIKQLLWQGWDAYGSDNGTPLVSLDEKKKFAEEIVTFAMAEWADEAPEGSSHCYYYDEHGEYASAFLAKHHLHVDEHLAIWKQESGFLRCRVSAEDCAFINDTV